MARDPENRLEDWMRLILLNWVMISFIMFYSILMGLAGGCIVVLFSTAVIEQFGLPTRFLHLYPSPAPASILVIGGLIAAFFSPSVQTPALQLRHRQLHPCGRAGREHQGRRRIRGHRAPPRRGWRGDRLAVSCMNF